LRSSTVGVVIPAYDHARFLGDALDSVTAQTRPADEIVVVDDGSRDDPGAVAARYPGVRLLRQANAGLSAARNAGLAAIAADYVVFLDADDVLDPSAIASNLALFAENPAAGFVYGGYERVTADLRLLLGPCYIAAGDDPLATFLERNAVGMHAAVLYSAARLRDAGGFDPSLRSCEDYDVYLQMAKRYGVVSRPGVIARYRIHDTNMSGDPARMLKWALRVHARHKPSGALAPYLPHWKAGRRHWRRVYADAAFDGQWGTHEGGSLAAIASVLPLAPRRVLQRAWLALASAARNSFSGRPGAPHAP
jgi:glycosyltransferase involved in cell wall biosynthesis